MKKRTLLAALALAALTAACSSTESPTAARAPGEASYDGGSIGSGHIATTTTTPSDSTGRGGSIGSGH